MRNIFILTFIFNSFYIFCQSPFKNLQGLSYNQDYSEYVPPPINEYKELGSKREAKYYENRKICNEIEVVIIQNLQSLRIDSINNVYRDGLKRNLQKIRTLKTQGEYADYTILLMDIIDDLNSNNIYYKNEDEYIKDLLLEEQMKKKDEEIRRLKAELEYHKNISSLAKTKPKQTKKLTHK